MALLAAATGGQPVNLGCWTWPWPPAPGGRAFWRRARIPNRCCAPPGKPRGCRSWWSTCAP